MITPLVLELDDELSEGEEMIGIKTIHINMGGGKRLQGHVAIIKNFNFRNELRYGNLKAYKYDKLNIGKGVV